MAGPHVGGIHHVKLPVTDLKKTQAFYTDILGLEYIPEYDHKTAKGELFAVLLRLKQGGKDMLIEMRHNEEQALKQEGWDPVTWEVESRKDLEQWKAWLELNHVQCSKVFTALKSWVLCALDPDRKIVRFYCDEEHEWTTDFDHDKFWLGG